MRWATILTVVIANLIACMVVPVHVEAAEILTLSLDEIDSEPLTAEDSSGNGNDGTLINGPSWTDGQVGGALSFDGVDDYVRIEDDPSFDLSGAITVAVWIRPETTKGKETILSKFAGNRKDLLISVARGELVVSLAGPGGLPAREWKPGVTISAGVWTHIVMAYDGGTMRIYKDGVRVAETPANGDLLLGDFSSDEPLLIGANKKWGEYFKGAIDEVRIYDLALSATEVSQLYTPQVVPHVVGLSEAEAEAAIIDANLAVGAVTYAYDETVTAGVVISQAPPGGESAVFGSAVDLVVSNGPAPGMVTVPHVEGLSQGDAKMAIISASLSVGDVAHGYSPVVPAGDIISQNPVAGTSVVINSAVDLVVSDGPEMVTVPFVEGLSQGDAEMAITLASLTVGEVTHAYSLVIPAGNIAGQYPVAGTTVVIGSAVDMVVSDGPETVTVPEVEGLSQADAETAIVSANLAVGVITYANDDVVAAGAVISQDPSAGGPAIVGSAVDLVVSNGPGGGLAELVDNAMTFAASQLAKTAGAISANPYPGYTENSYANWHLVGPSNWTAGFFPGSLWRIYESTSDPDSKMNFLTWAQNWTAGLETGAFLTASPQDLGFLINNTFGAGFRLTGNPEYKNVVLQAAQAVEDQFDSTIGAVTAGWGSWVDSVNMDSMMAVELLFWAAKNGGKSEWYDEAVSHATRVMRDHVRDDGSTYHFVKYNSETGAVIDKVTFQGYSDDSCWSRGQAWAIYGFTVTYRETGDPVFLQTAEDVATYFVDHLPSDGVPRWDFDAPSPEKDTSAAAIAASGLLELSLLASDDAHREKYYGAASNILTSLCTGGVGGYLARDANGNPLGPGILLEGCYHHPDAPSTGDVCDESLSWGDYYFIEAMQRYLALP